MTVEAQVTIHASTAAVWATTTNIARFAWAYDPEGNKIELWEPKLGDLMPEPDRDGRPKAPASTLSLHAMKLLLVNITDPRKEKLVTDILNEIEGVEVRKAPKEVAAPKRGVAKTARTRRPKLSKPMNPQEKKFVKGLTQAFKEMDEHIAGKRKLKTLKEVLDEL